MEFVVWVLLSFVVAHFANRKGQSNVAFFFVSLLLSPLIGALLLLISKDKSDEVNIEKKISKKCPKCAEIIKYEAVKCRFCGASIE